MKTAIVILNWNGKGFLEKFLPGVLASVGHDRIEGPREDAEVIVVDNASTDGSLEYLAAEFPGVHVVTSDKNYGFTGGYNRYFDQIWEEYGDNPPFEYCVLMNTDIEVTDGWLYPLEEWMDLHEDCAICAPKLLSCSDREKFEYAGAAGGLLDEYCFPLCRGRVMDRVAKDEGQYDMPAEMMWVSGACLMIRARLWWPLGGFDPEFFAHMEEIDLCWRARLAGWKVCAVPRSVVYHVGGGTLPQDSPFKLFLNLRNSLLMMRKNLAKTCAFRLLYDFLSINAPEVSISTDDVENCLEVLAEYPEDIRMKVIRTCARAGLREARRTIFKRMVLDGGAWMMYLLKGKKDCRDAVVQAHQGYRKLKADVTEEDIITLIIKDMANGSAVASVLLDIDIDRPRVDRVRIKGMIDKPALLYALAYKDKVFEYLDI